MTIIEVKNLKKEYKVNIKKEGLSGAILNVFKPKYEMKHAVKGVDFKISQGEMVGYIGANGAGKSTTIKMLTGILMPTSGSVIIDGLDPFKNRIQNNMKIGAVFGQRTQMWWDLPVIESYKLIQKIYEVPEERFQDNLKFYSDYLDLHDLLEIPVRQLSLGQKMRCEIAAAFIHDPKLVFLDEPTIGLDFMVKEKIREFIKILNKEKNITVILTTHDLQDIEEICERIIIIDNGMIVYDGSLEEIKSKFCEFAIVDFMIKTINIGLDEVLEAHSDKLTVLSKDPHNLSIKFNRNIITVAGVISIIAPFCNIADLSIKEDSIDTIIKDLYEKKLFTGAPLN
ncbi:MAG: ATP-binding cassette domain-containing protein [bacterium]